MLTYKYTWVLYVDGAKVMEVQDLYTFLCYKLVSNSGFVRYMSESGIHGNIETFGLLGGFKYEHTGFATPVLEDDLT